MRHFSTKINNNPTLKGIAFKTLSMTTIHLKTNLTSLLSLLLLISNFLVTIQIVQTNITSQSKFIVRSMKSKNNKLVNLQDRLMHKHSWEVLAVKQWWGTRTNEAA